MNPSEIIADFLSTRPQYAKVEWEECELYVALPGEDEAAWQPEDFPPDQERELKRLRKKILEHEYKNA